MRWSVGRYGSTPVEPERPEDGLQRGIGALLLLAGSALVFSESRMHESSMGGSLAVLLLLVGSGLLTVRRP